LWEVCHKKKIAPTQKTFGETKHKQHSEKKNCLVDFFAPTQKHTSNAQKKFLVDLI
jgi:hypothetical protein